MRIVVALTYYAPHWTGLSVVARRLAEGMAARGHEVTVVTSQHDPSLPQEEQVARVRVVRVPARARVSRTVVMPSYPAALAREIAAADVVHLQTPMPEAALVAALARRHRRRLVITHHGDVVMPSGLTGQAIRRAMELSNGLAMRSADAVVVHTSDYADSSRFLQRWARALAAFPPPVVIPAPRDAEARSWRQELGLGDRPVVGFAGRFVEEKGFDQLLRAMPLVARVIPQVRFVFAGDTDISYERFYERCRDLVSSQDALVTRLGLVRDPQRMADFYRMCDVFALPSRSDCFAIVQVEALLSGTPVVATAIPGAREVVRRTGAGRLVRPGDVRDLADGLVHVLRDTAAYRPDVAAVRRTFDPEQSLDRYERLLGAVPEPNGMYLSESQAV